jgi:hypothetical protein
VRDDRFGCSNYLADVIVVNKLRHFVQTIKNALYLKHEQRAEMKVRPCINACECAILVYPILFFVCFSDAVFFLEQAGLLCDEENYNRSPNLA